MANPAFRQRKWTAGKTTQLTKKLIMTLGAAIAVTALCAFSPAGKAYAASPFERELRTITVTEKVSYGTDYVDIPSVYKGYTELVSEGIPGERLVEAQVLFEGSRAVKVVGIKSTETAEPVNQVVRRGTKVVRTTTSDGSRWKKSFVNPLKAGWLSADFYDYRGHNGIDIAAPYGTPVKAAAGGTVSLARWYGDYGRCVIIDHPDGSQTLYGHNSSLNVQAGQTVKQGQVIAKVGSTGNSTGNHVHFEIRTGGRFLDPLIYMDK